MQPPSTSAPKVPNAATREAIRQAQTGEGLISYGSVEELMAELSDPGLTRETSS